MFGGALGGRKRDDANNSGQVDDSESGVEWFDWWSSDPIESGLTMDVIIGLMMARGGA